MMHTIAQMGSHKRLKDEAISIKNTKTNTNISFVHLNSIQHWLDTCKLYIRFN